MNINNYWQPMVLMQLLHYWLGDTGRASGR